MAAPQLVVRVAANLSEMKTNLTEGVSQIETYTSALKNASNAYDGSRVVAQANAAAAAIQNAGGVTALTASEMAKANTIFEAAAQKLQLAGQGASFQGQMFAKLADETKVTHAETVTLAVALDQVASKFGVSAGEVTEFLGPFGKIPVVSVAVAAGIAAVGVGIYELGSHAAESGEHLTDMSLKMGISTASTAELNFAINAAGGNIDTLSNAVFMMSKRLEDSGASGDKARAAVAELGINVDQFLKLPINEQILALSDNFRKVAPSAAEVNDIFGRQGKEILPQMLKPLSELVDKYHEFGGLSPDTIKAEAEQAEATRLLGGEWSLFVDSLGSKALPVLSLVNSYLQYQFDNWGKLKGAVSDGTETIEEYAIALGSTKEAVLKILPVEGAATTARQKSVQTLLDEQKVRVSNSEAMEAEKKLIEEEKKQVEEDTKAHEKFLDAMERILQASRRYQDVLAEEDPELVATVKSYLDMGASVRDVATVLDLTVPKVEAIKNALDHQNDSLDEAAKKWGDLEAAQHASIEAMDKEAEASAKKQAAITAAASAAAGPPGLPPGGSATYDMSTQAGFDRYFRENTAAEITAAGLQAHIAPAWFTNGRTLQDAIELKLIDPYAWWKQHPLGFADGVQNAPSGWAMVGERGPELMKFRGGEDVIPNHALGAMGGMTVNVYVSGAIVGTQTQLAQLVGEAFMAQQRGSGQRFPVTMQGR